MNVGDKLKLIVDPDSMNIGYMHNKDSKWSVTGNMKSFLLGQCSKAYTGRTHPGIFYKEAEFTISKVNKTRDGKLSSIKLKDASDVLIWPPEIFEVSWVKNKIKPIKLSFDGI